MILPLFYAKKVYRACRHVMSMLLPGTKAEPEIAITAFDTEKFVLMLEYAVDQLEEHRSFINRINVYPVPDGDTGTNMFNTLSGAFRKFKGHRFDSFAQFSPFFIDQLILNARGNAGSILSEYFKGFLAPWVNADSINAKLFCLALRSGSEHAQKALENPKRGTILDVFQGASQGAELAYEDSDDIITILESALQEAKKSLENTRDIMPQMKKARVVDAGGAGFLYMLGGYISALKNKTVVLSEEATDSSIAVREEEDIQFRYCTECILRSPRVNREQFRELIIGLGDSLHIVVSEDIIKLHIHTNEPDTVKRICEANGVIADWKVDDMQDMQKKNLQRLRRSVKSPLETQIAFVVDSSADLPARWLEKYPIIVVPIAITAGQDGTDLSETMQPDAMYERMRSDASFVPQTGAPTAEQFVKAYKQALELGDIVFCLPISSRISATCPNALKAKEILNDQNVHVIDSRCGSTGIAFLIDSCLKANKEGKDLIDITTGLYARRDNLQIYLIADDLKYLERGGRISKKKSALGRLLGVNPLLRIQEGVIVDTGKKIYFSSPAKQLTFLCSHLAREHEKQPLQRISIVHAYAADKAKQLASQLVEQLHIEPETVDVSPLSIIIGAHLGPGSLGIIYY
ncbi:MAG TPA: DegV family protein [bacterium]|nr:DegV family protein [bacterium]